MDKAYVRLFVTTCTRAVTDGERFADRLTWDDQTTDRGAYALKSTAAPEVLVYPATYMFCRTSWGEIVVSPPLDDQSLTLDDLLESGVATIAVAPPGDYWTATELADRTYEH